MKAFSVEGKRSMERGWEKSLILLVNHEEIALNWGVELTCLRSSLEVLRNSWQVSRTSRIFMSTVRNFCKSLEDCNRAGGWGTYIEAMGGTTEQIVCTSLSTSSQFGASRSTSCKHIVTHLRLSTPACRSLTTSDALFDDVSLWDFNSAQFYFVRRGVNVKLASKFDGFLERFTCRAFNVAMKFYDAREVSYLARRRCGGWERLFKNLNHFSFRYFVLRQRWWKLSRMKQFPSTRLCLLSRWMILIQSGKDASMLVSVCRSLFIPFKA